MGLRSWWAARHERKGSVQLIASADDLEAYLLGTFPISKSGQQVNYKTAMQACTAFACARVIADGISQIPLKLFRKAGANRGPAESHPLYDLLYASPNEWQTAYEFMNQVGFHLVFCGNAFVWKNRVRGEIRELLPFEPQWVTVDRTGWELTYKVSTDEGKYYEIPASEMWHIRGPSWNGWMGLEGVKLARESIGLAMALDEHGARQFQNGATLSGILTTDAQLTDEARAKLRESWQARHAGSKNAFKTAVLWGGMKWQPMGTPNDQAQFIESRNYQVEDVCRNFNVLPIMVGHSDKAATYASAEVMFQQHQTKTMHPWYSLVTGSANKNLLTPQERRAGYYFKFVVNALMYASAKDRAEYWWKLYQMGALNPNEIREFDEMNPYDGGDKFYRPQNMQDVNEPAPDPGGGGQDNGQNPVFPHR